MSDKNNMVEIFSKEYQSLIETDKKKFSRIVSKLLKETFILKELPNDKDDYFFLMENKEMMNNYFGLIDYDFIHDVFNSTFYIKTLEDRNRIRLSKFDTSIILILRKLYFLKRKEISSSNSIVVDLYDVMDELRTSKIFSDDKKASVYEETLRKLKNYKIIDYSSNKVDENLQIHILPSIQIIVFQDKLDDIIIRLNGLKKDILEEGADNEDVNED